MAAHYNFLMSSTSEESIRPVQPGGDLDEENGERDDESSMSELVSLRPHVLHETRPLKSIVDISTKSSMNNLQSIEGKMDYPRNKLIVPKLSEPRSIIHKRAGSDFNSNFIKVNKRATAGTPLIKFGKNDSLSPASNLPTRFNKPAGLKYDSFSSSAAAKQTFPHTSTGKTTKTLTLHKAPSPFSKTSGGATQSSASRCSKSITVLSRGSSSSIHWTIGNNYYPRQTQHEMLSRMDFPQNQDERSKTFIDPSRGDRSSNKIDSIRDYSKLLMKDANFAQYYQARLEANERKIAQEVMEEKVGAAFFKNPMFPFRLVSKKTEFLD